MTKVFKFVLIILCISLSIACDDNNLESLADMIEINDELSTDSIFLPSEVEGVKITWESNNEEVINLKGEVNLPHYSLGEVIVRLTAKLANNGKEYRREFNIKVKGIKPTSDHQIIIDNVYNNLMINEANNVMTNLNLPKIIDGVKIAWKSSNVEVVTDGGIVKRPLFINGNESVTLSASLSYNGLSRTKTFEITVIKRSEILISVDFNLVSGFASLAVEKQDIKNGDNGYYKVSNEKEFIEAISAENNIKLGTYSAKVIELTNDLNLGYKEVLEKYPTDTFNKNVFQEHKPPKHHPKLVKTGVSKIVIQDRNDEKAKYGSGLVIFSKNGSSIKHCGIVIKRSNNIVIRNLVFDELWEYDDSGKYDSNDWDYLTLESVDGAWIDHITMGKAYDGLIDMKKESKNVSITWSLFEVKRNEFIEEQIHHLEKNRLNYSNYNKLRNQGLSVDDIILLNSMQKKGHLVGANEMKEENNTLTISLAFNKYYNLQDRLPRLRAGDAHVYNVIHDASNIYELRQKFPSVQITNQGLVTTENGAILMEDSIFIAVETAIKNNQKSDSKGEFTGKYKVVNSMYIKEDDIEISSSNEDGSSWKRANSAEIIDFSFNNFDALPYEYELVEVSELEDFLNEFTVGAFITDIDLLDFGGKR